MIEGFLISPFSKGSVFLLIALIRLIKMFFVSFPLPLELRFSPTKTEKQSASVGATEETATDPFHLDSEDAGDVASSTVLRSGVQTLAALGGGDLVLFQAGRVEGLAFKQKEAIYIYILPKKVRKRDGLSLKWYFWEYFWELLNMYIGFGRY